ncbi:MAG: phage terminase large subunit [Lachnospiraceae bacterium]|nr:phage terminase large subunit [Lachnospiraceae bacterium]
MGSIAKEYKEKLERSLNPSEYELAANNFWEYEKQINPKFFKEDRWHLKEIAETLQALVEDRIIKVIPEREWKIATPDEVERLKESGTRYLICHKLKLNIPPRHGKSYTLALFEQWLLGKDNNNTIITVSYNETLSSRFSSNVRDGIDATKIDKKLTIFSDIFPNTKIKYGDAAKNIWALAGRFFSYLGTAFGGTITGVGCKLGVIDDPVKNSEEAFNDKVLEDQWSWYTDTYLSRIEEGGYQIINMTRWSSKDLCGRLEEVEESDEWYTLMYPACMNAEKIFKIIDCKKSRMVENCMDCNQFDCCHYLQDEEKDENGDIIGKMICKELLSFKSWDRKRKLTSLPIFMANYQQQPVDVTGALYSAGFKTYDPFEINEDNIERTLNYTDTADTGDDHLCSISFDVIDRYGYIKDVYFTDEPMEVTEDETARRMKMAGVREGVIESNNGGRGFARNVEKLFKKWGWRTTSIFWFTQSKNKRARIISHSSNVCDQMIMPEGWEKKWPEFYKAVTTYQRKGKNPHDDAPDCLTGCVELINGEVKVKQRVKTVRKSRLGLR